MERTFELYEEMNSFRKAQIANRETYLQKKKNLDRYTGSVGYADDLKKIQEEREKANAAARAACKAKIVPIFKAMREANAKRKITAPSEEAIRILTAVKMLDKPSKAYMDVVANSLEGNGLALAVLDQIARDAWRDSTSLSERWTPNYSSDRAVKEYDPQVVAEAINSLERTCNSILDGSGANRTREYTAGIHQRKYGGEVDLDSMPQEPEYQYAQEFYKREAPGLNYDLFRAAVNGGT